MGTRTQHTKTDLSRCVARLLLAAQHALLAVGSRRGGPPLVLARVRVRFGGNSPPLPTNWSVLFSSSEYFFALVCPFSRAFFCCCGAQATVCAWHCGPARVLPAARAAAATPRRVTSKVQSSVRFLFRRKPKAAEILAEDRFFFELFLDLISGWPSPRRASLGG